MTDKSVHKKSNVPAIIEQNHGQSELESRVWIECPILRPPRVNRFLNFSKLVTVSSRLCLTGEHNTHAVDGEYVIQGLYLFW